MALIEQDTQQRFRNRWQGELPINTASDEEIIAFAKEIGWIPQEESLPVEIIPETPDIA